MGLIPGFVKRWLDDGGMQKAQGGNSSALALLIGGQAYYPSTSYADIARIAYKRNTISYRCIQAIITAFAASPMVVYYRKNDDPVPADHPAQMLLKRPNDITTAYRFWETYFVHRCIAGAVPMFKERSLGVPVSGLVHLRPDRVKAVAGARLVSHYIYSINGAETIIPLDDMAVDVCYDPLNDVWGQSPLEAALVSIATDNEASSLINVTLRNKGVSPGKAVLLERSSQPSKQETEAASQSWELQFGGDGRGKTGFFGGVKDIKDLSMSFADMDLSNLSSRDEARICMALGVPPILAGAKVGLDRSTFSNFEEARKSFHEDTVEPLQNAVDDVFNAFILPEFGDDIYCRFDNSKVSALVGARNSKITSITVAMSAGLFTRNEARGEVGLPQVKNGDIFLQPISTIERGMDDAIVPEETALSKYPFGVKKARSPEARKFQAAVAQSSAVRLKIAKTWAAKTKRMAEGLLDRQWKDFREELPAKESKAAQVRPETTIQMVEALERALIALQAQWKREAQLAAVETFTPQIETAAALAAELIGTGFDLSTAPLTEFIHNYSFKFADKFGATTASEVRAVMTKALEDGTSIDALSDLLAEKFKDMKNFRPDLVAQTETIRASNYGAKEAWRQMGVTKITWLASSDACDDCLDLDGKTISIIDDFIPFGGTLPVSGAKVNYEAIAGPPAHVKCECTTYPEMENADV